LKLTSAMSDADAHWQRLGISPTRDKRSIELAYRKLALRYHPDRNLNAPADVKARNEAKFKELVESCEYCIGTLTSSPPPSSPFRSATNNSSEGSSSRTPHASAPPSPPNAGRSIFAAFESFANFAEYFEDCIRKVEAELRWQQRVPLEVTLQELYCGVVIEVELANHAHRCTDCDAGSTSGTGPANAKEGFARARRRFLSHLTGPQGWESAFHLAASGLAIIASASSVADTAASSSSSSSSCTQRLEQEPQHDPCVRCKGSGSVSRDVCIRVAVPARSHPGQEIVFRDQASWTPAHSSSGDLVFVLDAPKQWLAPNGDEWLAQRDGVDGFHVTVAVSLRDALFGNDCLLVSHLDGTKFPIVVHPREGNQPPDVAFCPHANAPSVSTLKAKVRLPTGLDKLSASDRQALDTLLSHLQEEGSRQ
jgi:DnaJ-class molecular chaperone